MHILSPINTAFWWDVARTCSYATFFHTPLWHELAVCARPQQRDATIGAVLPSGVRVVLPLLRVRSAGPLRDLYSTAALCYGDLIADGPLSPNEVQQVYRAACSWRVLRLQLTGNPLASHPAPTQHFSGESDSTHILPLQPDFNAVFAGFSSGHRSNYNKGLRKGIQVRVGDTLEDYRAYYRVYEDSLRRWHEKKLPLAGNVEPWALFEAGYRLAQQHPDRIKLWVAELDGLIISGAWVFYWNEHAVYWHGATYDAYFDYRPNIVVHTHAIRDAVERNYTSYDFNPSGGLAGVIEFKRRFGAEQRPFMRWKYGDAKFARLRTVQRHLGTLAAVARGASI